MDQIYDISWKRESENEKFHPTVELAKDDINLSKTQLDTNFTFDWKLNSNQYCTGVRDFGKRIPCPKNNIVTKIEMFCQCDECEAKQGFKAAFMFGKKPTELAKKFIDQTYFVYLAYFADGTIKVGVAGKDRKFKRLLEQDAFAFRFIAERSGFEIQNLEKYISKNFKITEMVKSAKKFKTLSIHPERSIADKALQTAHKQIIDLIHDQETFLDWIYHFDNVNTQFADDFAQIYYTTDDPILISDTDIISGRFLGLRGKYLLIENNAHIFALNMNHIRGRKIIKTAGTDYESFLPQQFSLGL